MPTTKSEEVIVRTPEGLEDWDVTVTKDGDHIAVGKSCSLTVSNEVEGSKIRKTTAFKTGGVAVRCLWGELDGVRVYCKTVNGHVHLLMTKQELNPQVGDG